MTNLAVGQNLFEMIIWSRGLAKFWLRENICTTNPIKLQTNQRNLKISIKILDLNCNILHINEKWVHFPLVTWNMLGMTCYNFSLKTNITLPSTAAVPDEIKKISPKKFEKIISIRTFFILVINLGYHKADTRVIITHFCAIWQKLIKSLTAKKINFNFIKQVITS